MLRRVVIETSIVTVRRWPFFRPVASAYSPYYVLYGLAQLACDFFEILYSRDNPPQGEAPQFEPSLITTNTS